MSSSNSNYQIDSASASYKSQSEISKKHSDDGASSSVASTNKIKAKQCGKAIHCSSSSSSENCNSSDIQRKIEKQRNVVSELSKRWRCRSQLGLSENCLGELQTKFLEAKQKLKCLISKQHENPSKTKLIQFSETLINDNDNLNEECRQLQNEVMRQNESVEEMEEKVNTLENLLLGICCENKELTRKLEATKCSEDSQEIVKSKLNAYIDKSEQLSCEMHQLECHIEELECEISRMKKEKTVAKCLQIEADGDLQTKKCPCSIGDNLTEIKMKQIQSQYTDLQKELYCKDKECKEMCERLKKMSGNCKEDEQKALNEALKLRADKLKDEINDSKILIKELQEQVDMYREKFMKAQEKVEYQRYMLENLEMNNKDIESQINVELAQIKEKFQEKLKELCPYPKKYEECRLELEEMIEKRNNLENDLKKTVEALAKASKELKVLQNPDDSLEKKYKQLQCEVEAMKEKYCGMKATKECLEEKLSNLKMELERLRKDSSKIITTTKCCAEKNRDVLHQHINCLEIDLAQCRASAALSINEKEEVIAKMKQELSSLCGHFSDCQAQILQLKNQIVYLTNQRHNIDPKELNKIDYCFPKCD
ncbi:CLUMA_CG013653, isoform A [Clunio marinus]|uniref:CLUMA_CG013653, isoform A n=1 Tax=Clunio marinus TaxID=568069 RepID=A0A1J1IPG6_9DIPT|nr:CLUMA_CG013653, isoform A [Clunio marinus]